MNRQTLLSTRTVVIALAALLIGHAAIAAPGGSGGSAPGGKGGGGKKTTTTTTSSTSTSRPPTTSTSSSTSTTAPTSTSTTTSSTTSTAPSTTSTSSSTSSTQPPSTSTSTVTTSTVTTSTSTSTTLVASCLDGTGPLITLTGTWDTTYDNRSLLDETRLDARTATFLPSPTNLYPMNLGGGSTICLSGGLELGQYDRSLSWDAMHTMNNAGVRFENPGFTVENTRVDNVTDGIRPIAGPFTIRGTWLSYVRDDCVENDHVQPGLIDDSLFDGCYVGISERPSPAIIASGYDGHNDLLTIRGSLIRLEPMPGPRGGATTDFGNGQFFKWDSLATQLELHDDVFMAEQVGESGASTMGIPSSLTACSNNVMVWLGAGPYPAPLPDCFTVTTDRAVWDAAVASWKVRHGVTP